MPRNPGPFTVIPPLAAATRTTRTRTVSAIEIAELKASHDKDARQDNKYNAVEQALCQQIIDTIEPGYLEELRNYDIDMIHDGTPQNINSYKTHMGK